MALLQPGQAARPPSGTAPWKKLSGLPGGSVSSIVFDVANPGVAFAGVENGGLIYRSTDGGATWKPIQVGSLFEGFRAFAVSPATVGTIYAYSTDISASGLGKVYRSTDDGRSWAALANQPGGAASGYYAGLGRGIVIDSTGQHITLADGYSGLFQSSDGGNSWTNPVTDARGYGLAANPAKPGTIYAAGQLKASSQAAIWNSTDYGVTWSVQTPAAMNKSAGAYGYGIAVQPGTGAIFANWFVGSPGAGGSSGIVVSKNGGKKWAASNNGLLPDYYPGNAAEDIVFDPTTPSTVYLSTNGSFDTSGGGFYVSMDSGADWQPIGNRIPTGLGYFAALRPAETGYAPAIFTGNPDVLISTDGAATWARSDTGVTSDQVFAVADDGIATNGYYAAVYGGLSHTTDGGKIWNRISNWAGLQYILSFAVDPVGASHPIYARTLDATTGNAIWRSADQGNNWTNVTPTGDAEQVFTSPNVANTLFVLSGLGTVVSRSTDGGTSWASTQVGNSGDYSTTNLVVAHAPAGRLYLGLSSGLWQSNDGGATWALAATQPFPGGGVASIAEVGGKAHALLMSGTDSTATPSVVRSTDQGASYQPVATLNAAGANWTLSAAPNGQQILALANVYTVALSKDGGATWTIEPNVLAGVSSDVLANLSATSRNAFFGDFDGAFYTATYGALQ